MKRSAAKSRKRPRVSAAWRRFRELAVKRHTGSSCTQKNFDRAVYWLSNEVCIVEIGLQLRELFKILKANDWNLKNGRQLCKRLVDCNGLGWRLIER